MVIGGKKDGWKEMQSWSREPSKQKKMSMTEGPWVNGWVAV